jgi:serine/threonine-protein kinase
MIGTKLAHYEITAHLGSGGMGDVYRARDTKLKRDVAIKLLPEEFARDSDRVARFQREAEVLASLNHPNIAAIYDFQHTDEARFLVIELVEGESLSDRIKRGPLPVDEALEIGKSICEALEAAHEKGIVHRDLKPANVKITPDGKVKVLDFGLARAMESSPASAVLSNSPTLINSIAETNAGMIIGTAAYMSPEQARGKAVTKAADIWAFGCVLYEMLTGKAAFEGEDVATILAAVMMREPVFDTLPANIPPAIRTLLHRCLRKERQQRLQDATGIRIEIEEALAAPLADKHPTWPADVGSYRAAALIGTATLLIGLAIGVWLRTPSVPQQLPQLVRLDLSIAPGTELGEFPTLTVSPDGTQVAYVATRGGVQQIYLRPLASVDAKPLPGTEGAVLPFFSPDGKWLGFFAGGKLKKISTGGGVSVTLADSGNQGGSWSSDDTILFRESRSNGFAEVPAKGGAVRRIPTPDPQRLLQPLQQPEFLPDGKTALFSSPTPDGATADDKVIGVVTLETGQQKILVQGGSHPHYLPTGHLVFMRSGTLMAVPFDVTRLEITGIPVPVLEGIRESVTGIGAFSCSRTGTCASLGGGMIGAQRTALLVDRSGANHPLPIPPRSYGHPRFSAGGDKVSFWIEQVNCDVLIYDVARSAFARLTDNGDNHYPTWTADGKRITYLSRKTSSSPSQSYELYWKPADGSGPEEKLTSTPLNLAAGGQLSWSPNGKVLAFVDRGDIWLLPLEGERKAKPFFQSKFDESMPAFSPDGRWLAYVSDESGRPEVYVQPFPEPGSKYPISVGGGTEPVWARSGRELFYRSDDQMMVVAVTEQPGFSASSPKLLFVGPFARTAGRTNYDVSPDGQHFLMFKVGQQAQASSQINVVINWFRELQERVPVK